MSLARRTELQLKPSACFIRELIKQSTCSGAVSSSSFLHKDKPISQYSSLVVLVLARSDTSGLQKGKRQETGALATPWTAKKHQPQSQCNISQIGIFSTH